MGDQEFEKRFREEFLDFEADPAPNSWEQIQAGLQKSSTRAYTWRRIAVAVLLCFIFVPLGKQNYTYVEQDMYDEEVTPLPEARIPSVGKDPSPTLLHEIPHTQPSSQGKSKAGKVEAEKTSSPVLYPMPVNSLSSQGITTSATDLILPATIPPPTYEQETIVESLKNQVFSKMRVYVEGTPLLAYHHFSPSTRDAVLIDSYTSASSFNKDRLGYQLSLGLDVNLAPRIQITIGLFYSLQRQAVTFQASELEENRFEQTENGYNITPAFISTAYQYQLSYHSVGGHIMGLYQLWPAHKGKTQQVGIGFQGSYLMNYREIVEDTDTFLSVSQQAYSVNLAYRVTYRISPQLFLSFQPAFNYFFTNNKQTAPISARPYTFGIGVGIRYGNRDR